MTGEPTEVETSPEIVAVEHPSPEIVSSTVDESEGAAVDVTTPEPNPDQAADEDEDRQSRASSLSLGERLTEKAPDVPVPGQLTIDTKADAPVPEPKKA